MFAAISLACQSILSQDDSMKSVVAVNSQPTSIPLLMACTANVKTVVANPIVYLTNLTHDILQTINALNSPPHPDVVNNESVLLSQKQALKTIMDEAVHPNTSPGQWPGEETQPGLAVLLCEILTAVFLSLFVHGMATHSSNELFRIVAHPLNCNLWEESGIEREGPSCPRIVVEQESTSVFKEQFVPPEISIWDYFIAKEEVQETFIRNIFTKKPGTNQLTSFLGNSVSAPRIVVVPQPVKCLAMVCSPIRNGFLSV
ncbi:hypothetical protein XENOCAPTIV_027259 [Xenoophorus captivus]|uniref:Uncharacterized protein n=1 Tax=Xenoophorus captivus TaxID=1517983 RepID=A0ABV0QUA6_9TELE